LLAVLIAIPHQVGAKLPVYNNAVIMVIVFLSLSLLVRTSGQVSLCHAGFAAVGAAVFSHLAPGAGLPWAMALLGAGLAAVPIGAIVAIPAIRIAGVYLALATFGFGILLERMAYPTSMMFGSFGTRTAPRPKLGGIDLTSNVRYYYVCLAFMVLVAAISVVINRSRLGRPRHARHRRQCEPGAGVLHLGLHGRYRRRAAGRPGRSDRLHRLRRFHLDHLAG